MVQVVESDIANFPHPGECRTICGPPMQPWSGRRFGAGGRSRHRLKISVNGGETEGFSTGPAGAGIRGTHARFLRKNP